MFATRSATTQENPSLYRDTATARVPVSLTAIQGNAAREPKRSVVQGQTALEPAEREASIAVLPFSDMSSSKTTGVFRRNPELAEEIINALTKDFKPQSDRSHLRVRVQGENRDHSRDCGGAERNQYTRRQRARRRKPRARYRAAGQCLRWQPHLVRSRYGREMNDCLRDSRRESRKPSLKRWKLSWGEENRSNAR